jgi:hypothetical protein
VLLTSVDNNLEPEVVRQYFGPNLYLIIIFSLLRSSSYSLLSPDEALTMKEGEEKQIGEHGLKKKLVKVGQR